MNHMPTIKLNLISSLWPFTKWGLDIIGPFICGQGDIKYVFVAMNYLTKWANAKSYKMISFEDVVSIMYLNIIYWFGIPNVLTIDNGPQFDKAPIKKTCKKFRI